MKKEYIITGIIGLGLGVALWFVIKGNRKRRQIKEGSFTINVEE
jgi:hypothetical protein